ncbi:MAG: dephospho-CoA kinase, partial [Pseudomonadota bacterium]|nr:dephospho-CoA kinase [Pseudomonadota bacterium]
DVTEDIQEKRALSRKNMSKEKYLAIKANQIPNSEKINRSDFMINNHDEAKTRDNIEKIVKELNKLVSI